MMPLDERPFDSLLKVKAWWSFAQGSFDSPHSSNDNTHIVSILRIIG